MDIIAALMKQQMSDRMRENKELDEDEDLASLGNLNETGLLELEERNLYPDGYYFMLDYTAALTSILKK